MAKKAQTVLSEVVRGFIQLQAGGFEMLQDGLKSLIMLSWIAAPEDDVIKVIRNVCSGAWSVEVVGANFSNNSSCNMRFQHGSSKQSATCSRRETPHDRNIVY
ncbi:hypothetical protein AAFF_G00309150 [Aldrovandia affinis]|uniref:Uncharacterized protein n=1 Tax=Aldrovandia affinis TaxID=143900 RepID=A0AAD7SQ09_9TELE|nr:hypothetical protein AAFF_G00309150 [Aldrovandia affinis]